jgi:hypothetical protein
MLSVGQGSQRTVCCYRERAILNEFAMTKHVNHVDRFPFFGVDNASLDQILEFPDVSGIVVVEHRFDRPPRESCYGSAMPGTIQGPEMLHEKWDVVTTFAQWR